MNVVFLKNYYCIYIWNVPRNWLKYLLPMSYLTDKTANFLPYKILKNSICKGLWCKYFPTEAANWLVVIYLTIRALLLYQRVPINGSGSNHILINHLKQKLNAYLIEKVKKKN